MLDFLAMLAGVVITLLTVAGFVALGVVLFFEFAAMITLWLKHALNDPHDRHAT